MKLSIAVTLNVSIAASSIIYKRTVLYNTVHFKEGGAESYVSVKCFQSGEHRYVWKRLWGLFLLDMFPL